MHTNKKGTLEMKKIILSFIVSLLAAVSPMQAFANDNNNWNASLFDSSNCIASKWKDANGNPISIEEKFGPGTMANTHCLNNTKKVKALYQINTQCKNSACTAAYAIGNIQNHINDMVITHGMTADDYKIAVVVHSGGWKLILNDERNPFKSAMAKLASNPNITVMFCANTAAKKGVKFADMVPGVGFTSAGVSAISDLQEDGYRYVQP